MNQKAYQFSVLERVIRIKECIGSHSFTFGFLKRPHTKGDRFLTYKPMMIKIYKVGYSRFSLYSILQVDSIKEKPFGTSEVKFCMVKVEDGVAIL